MTQAPKTSPSDSWLDSLLDKGLGIASLFAPNKNQTSNAKAVTGQPTDWAKIGAIAGIALGVIFLAVALLKK